MRWRSFGTAAAELTDALGEGLAGMDSPDGVQEFSAHVLAAAIPSRDPVNARQAFCSKPRNSWTSKVGNLSGHILPQLVQVVLEFPLPGPAARRTRQKADQKKACKDDTDNPHRSLHGVSCYRCNESNHDQ